MREAARAVWQAPHKRAATKQTARQAAAHPGFDDMAPSAVLLALRICESYSTRLAPCIRGHLVRNAAHEGFCISLLVLQDPAPDLIELDRFEQRAEIAFPEPFVALALNDFEEDRA